MRDELARAWKTNNAINTMIIDKVTAEGWDATLSKRGGRGVAGEFAHMHNIRVWHIEKRAKDLAGGLEKFGAGVHPTKKEVKQALRASGDAIGELLVGALEGEAGRKGFKRGIFTTLSYFISHEAHHRGRILLTLKVSGNTLDRATASGIWAWDNI
jgi:uncharacterized damage-inducible protein DinB